MSHILLARHSPLSLLGPGDTVTVLDNDDDPLWNSAMSSPERE